MNLKQQTAMQNRIRKDIDTTKRKLAHERSLKLDAFQRVDDLQAIVSEVINTMMMMMMMMIIIIIIIIIDHHHSR